MSDKRQLRNPGDMLLLGGTEYRLEAVEGCGGSAVVYRASYEDQLNQGYRHYVLIKELFPYHPKGDIYRNEAGEICCRGDGGSIMERSRQNFYRGNQANLKLLEQEPGKISGNLNSYSAYGTFYSVLSVHGGKNLQTILEEGQELRTLRETAETILKILDAVACFHESGILHLDISPDNIILLPEQAFLIDYNSVWIVEEQKTKDYCFSEKPGYSATEVRLREWKNIGPATDLYSVCAVWLRMLTGQRLTDEDIMENRLQRKLPRDLEIFKGESDAAAQRTVQIVTKGLHLLARRRYQTVEELREDIRQLIRLIDEKEAADRAARRRKRFRAVFALIMLLAAGGACAWRLHQPHRLSAKEQYQLKEVLYQESRNLSALGIQLQIQQQVLENAAEREVLEGDEDAMAEFREYFAYKRKEAEHYSFERSSDKSMLETLKLSEVELPYEILEELLGKTYDMDIIMDEGLNHLEEGLDKTVLSYTERQELCDFYREYLDAYAEVTYRELCLVMVYLDSETEEELLAIISQTAVLKDYIRTCPYEGKSIKMLETELSTAKAHMKDCMNDMRTRNYVIPVPDWE